MTRKMAEISGAQQERRAVYPDVLRGFAIFLMLFGHSLQMGSGAQFREEALYFSDRVYQLIYSFHMPLFMVLSGALFAFSLERHGTEPFSRHLAGRLRRLILPVFLWSFIDLAAGFITRREAFSASVRAHRGIILYFLEHFLTSHWFLWAVFFSGLLVWIVRHFLKDSPVPHLLLLVLAFFVPDGLNAMMYKFLHPFFLIGYYGVVRSIRKEASLQEERRVPAEPSMKLRLPKAYTEQKELALVCSAIVFAALAAFYTRDTFIYVSGYKLIGKPSALLQLGTDLYRFAVGLAGSVCMLILWDVLLSFKGDRQETVLLPGVVRILSAVGRESLGIYIISQYVITGLLVPLADRLFPLVPSSGIFDLYALPEAAAVLAICHAAVILLGRSRVTGLLIGKGGR